MNKFVLLILPVHFEASGSSSYLPGVPVADLYTSRTDRTDIIEILRFESTC